jgi:HlyD family secretion protein
VRSSILTGMALLAVLGLAECTGPDDDLVLVGTVERTLIELTAPAFEEITGIPLEEGDPVEAGAVCVRFNTTLSQAEVARAEAAVAGARTASVLAEHEYARIVKLHQRRIASDQDLDRAEGEQDEAAARLREAQSLLAVAEKRLEDMTVVTPASGVVDQFPFEAGERVPAGAVVAVVLANSDPWVRVWIPQDAFATVAPGTRADITVDGIAGILPGRVRDVAREPEFTPHYALTERERVHLVYQGRVTILDAPPTLRPGMPAQVVIRTSGHGAEADSASR